MIIQLWSPLIVSRNQQRHPKRPTHNTLLAIRALPKAQCQIANRLRTALNAQLLVVIEGVVLGFYASMLDHAACIRLEAGHGAADVAVYFDDFFDGGGFEEGGSDALFDAENYAIGGCYLECKQKALVRLG
jgi:hypothetical protein